MSVRVRSKKELNTMRREANTLHVRAIAQNAKSFGKILEDYYAGASYGTPWNEAFAMVTSIKSDYMQKCEQVYSAE